MHMLYMYMHMMHLYRYMSMPRYVYTHTYTHTYVHIYIYVHAATRYYGQQHNSVHDDVFALFTIWPPCTLLFILHLVISCYMVAIPSTCLDMFPDTLVIFAAAASILMLLPYLET